MSKEIRKVTGIFLAAVVVYGIMISFFTSTVHIGSDEELYLEMAKSFHYRHRFEFNGETATYNCVLYSVLISFAYFFYSPENILFIVRLIGVITMCSAVFPTWLLARRVLEDEKQALVFSGFTMFLPYMFECGYVMQEILNFPIFMWAVYFLYLAVETEGEKRNYLWIVLGSVFSVLCFFCKSHLFFVPVVVNLIFLYRICRRKRELRSIGKLVLYDGVYCVLTAILYLAVLYLNGFEQGSNRYVDQFSHLFPVTWMTIACAVSLSAIYVGLTSFCTGIIPAAAVLFHHKELEGSKKWLADFTLVSCGFMVLETVFLATIPEEGLQLYPHRFLFRYFQMLVPLVFLLFVKVCQKEKSLRNRKIWIFSASVIGICLLYFFFAQGKTTQGIVDGFVFLVLENLSEYFMPYADVIVTAAAGCALLLLWRRGKKDKDTAGMFMKCGTAMVIALWLLNCVQLPVYNNIVAEGKTIQKDGIQIADYLNEEGYELVYYVNPTNGERYPRNFYGYIKQQYKVIEKTDVQEIASRGENTVFLALFSEEMMQEGLRQIDLDTEKLAVYAVEKAAE